MKTLCTFIANSLQIENSQQKVWIELPDLTPQNRNDEKSFYAVYFVKKWKEWLNVNFKCTIGV